MILPVVVVFSIMGLMLFSDTDRDLVNSGVVYVVQLLFYNLQGSNHYNNGHIFVVIYDIHIFNNNDAPSSCYLCNINDTPSCITGVENDCLSTIQYGNNSVSIIDIYGVIVVNLA